MQNDFDFVLAKLTDPKRAKPVKEIADEAGVRYFTIQKWMRADGTQSPRYHTVQKLATYFREQDAERRKRKGKPS